MGHCFAGLMVPDEICALWDITQRIVVIPYRRFGTTYRSHLQGSRMKTRTLEDGNDKKFINFIPVTNLMHKFLYSYNVTVLYMFQAVLC